jgi:glucose/arabinose dehydrogenase
MLLGAAYTFANNVAAFAATLPPGFAETRLASGMNNVTTMSLAPDGRIFVSEQAGRLRVIKDDALLAAPALTLTVDSTNERGLLGIAFDPAFAQTGFLYAYYTSPTPVPHNRISRFTMSGDVVAPGSEVTLLDLPPLGLAPIHNGGSMHVGIDGKLYISVGENFNAPNAQSLSITLGKLLRIDTDGTIPPDNPFYETLSGDNRAIWAYGLRNPYTFDIQPGTGRIFVNDVGDKLFDEIDEIVKGGNFGWPDTEGPHDDPRFEKPFYFQAWSPSTCTLIGAAFYNPVTRDFPLSYVGKYFFADLCGGYVKTIDPDTKEVENFATGLSTPVDLDVSPDGKLYYLNRGAGTGTGAVFRIFHSHPAPSISVHPEDQLVSDGETATFSCAGNGAEPLHYQWARSSVPIAGATSPTYSFTTGLGDDGALFGCILSNEDGTTASHEATLHVTSNKTPLARITTPAPGATYEAGQTLFFEGDATDAEDGPLPPSGLSWEILFDHDDHSHPGLGPISGITSGSYAISSIGETSPHVKYRIILRATDSTGLVRKVERDVRPKIATVVLQTNPSGRALKLDGQPKKGPVVFDGVVGIRRILEAPAFQQEAEASPVWYEFQSWSDGGTAMHEIATPGTDTTYTADFKRIEFPECITFETLSRFVNMPFANQTGRFMVEFDVTPTAFPVNANLGLSDRPRGGLPGQAAMVTFNTAGRIVGRDVTAGRADVVFPYQANVAYHVRMVVNLFDHQYDLYVTAPGSAEVLVAKTLGFRVEHALITQLNNWGVFASPVAGGGTLKVCHFEVNCSGEQNAPPVVAAPPDVVVRTGPGATACSRVVTDAELGVARATDNCARVDLVRNGVPAGNVFPVGTTLVGHTATDAGGLTTTVVQRVTVIDDTPPVVENVAVDKPVLAPPNHKMVDVAVFYEASDNCGAVTPRLAVTSNEPVDGFGDGNTSPDWEIVDATHVRLRAERSAFGNGRVYEVDVTATDASGNAAVQPTAVAVPRDGHRSIGEIVAELLEWLRRLLGLGSRPG